MKICNSEAEFQRWVVAAFESMGWHGHVQVHKEDPAYPGIPDLSVGAASRDYWLELKYGEFVLTTEHYERFEFKQVTRQQLGWLDKRHHAGGATCGILGYFQTLPHKRTQYVFFMPAGTYVDTIWRNSQGPTVGAIVLGPYVESAENIKTAEDLLIFIQHARYGQRVQRA